MHFLKNLKALFGNSGAGDLAQPQPVATSLEFKCVVKTGEGRFSRMAFPGRNALANAPSDWPENVQPGSLNCQIVTFPPKYDQIAGSGDRIQKLDKENGPFPPLFTIPRDMITNNSVMPRYPGDDPRMGIAQAWRCAVRNDKTGEEFSAWHVRRVDGTYPLFHGIIELVADRKLRDAHDLQDHTPLTIKMFCAPRP